MIPEWLAAPLSGTSTHAIAPWAVWHARWMVLGWAVLLPLGALAARFFKVLPRQAWPRDLDNRAWWHAHRGLQWGGVVAMSVGGWLALNQGAAASAAAQWHVGAGWALIGAGWLQVAASLARGSKGGPGEPSLRGDHYDMTPWRLGFERLHKGLGWLAVVAAIAVIVLGLVVADAPRWMLLTLCVWWLVLSCAFAALQRGGRCIDTYQAIWGPSLQHPGNHRAPTGWGVRRPLG